MTKQTLNKLVFTSFLFVVILLTILSCSKKSPDPAGPTPLSIITTAPSDITSTTAKGGGNITSDGGSGISGRGVCWSTTQNPALSDSHTNDGTGSGNFTSSITGLVPGTTYYLRAYATNSIGTGYGNEVSFTSQGLLPAVSTTAITNITQTSAT